MDVADLTRKLGRIISLAGGVRRALRTLLIGDLVAATLLVLGLVLLGFTGGWVIFAVILGVLALVPGLFVWRGMGMFEQIEQLPETLVDLGHLPERAVGEVRDVIATAVSPRGVKGAIWEARGLVGELTSILPIVDFVKSFNPLSLAVTAGAAAAVPIVGLIAAVIFAFGVLS